MKAYEVDDGIEIRDGETVITTVKKWPPKHPDKLEALFDAVGVNNEQKELFIILFGGANIESSNDSS